VKFLPPSLLDQTSVYPSGEPWVGLLWIDAIKLPSGIKESFGHPHTRSITIYRSIKKYLFLKNVVFAAIFIETPKEIRIGGLRRQAL
jgi:hypothetical protein